MYSVRRKQQMLKIRLMGTKSDIRWFQNFLQIDSDIEVLELSDIYPNKGTDRYYRSYAEVERKDGNAGRPTENGKSNRKKQIKAPVPPIKAKYPIMDWKNLPFNTAVWKESERLAGKEGYKHPVRVVYNPKTMTYRTILNKSKFQVKEEWDLSGTIEQCIIRYASKLDGDQMNEILLGLEEGLTDEQVKSYFKLPADQMKQYRREQLEKE